MSMAKAIPLTNSDRVATIDHDDEARINALNTHWSMDSEGRIVANRYQLHHLYLHHAVLEVPAGTLVHHKNGDHLDNRRSNLVVINAALKAHRRRKKPNATSRYFGVCRDNRRGRWQAGLHVNGKRISAGTFKVEADAARAYDRLAYQQYGPLANLNFPEEYPDNPDSIAHLPEKLIDRHTHPRAGRPSKARPDSDRREG